MGIGGRKRGSQVLSYIPLCEAGHSVENEGFNKGCVDTLAIRLWASVGCRVEEGGSEIRLIALGDRTMNGSVQSDLKMILKYI